MKTLTLGLVLYRLTVETGMPHLEENLRYATVDETRCLTHAELATVFPVLQHPALQDCALHLQSEDDDSIVYGLSCTGSHGTTGSAHWEISSHQLRGILNVRLGGKNMTFYQRITAVETGDSCDTSAARPHIDMNGPSLHLQLLPLSARCRVRRAGSRA